MTKGQLLNALKDIPDDVEIFVESPDVFNMDIVDMVPLENVIDVVTEDEDNPNKTKRSIALVSNPQSKEYRWN